MKLPGPSEIRVRDPLSDVTRKERRTLLGAAALGIVIVKSGLVPSKITALGIEFTRTDQQALLAALAAVVVYFLVAFVIYAASDLVAWRVAFHNAIHELERESRRVSEEAKTAEDRPHRGYALRRRAWFASSRPVSVVRALFEFAVPPAVGLYAVALLLTTTPPPVPTSLKGTSGATPLGERPNSRLERLGEAPAAHPLR